MLPFSADLGYLSPGMRAKNPPTLEYICLALLFALASAYQIGATLASFPDYFHREVADYPFVPNYVNGQPITQFVRPGAQRAGVRERDILHTVNGRPLTGLAVFGEAMRSAKPGDTLTVEVLRRGDTKSLG